MKSGVYQIILPNDQIYIGSGVSVKGRVYSHKNQLIKKTHRNRILQNLYNKYGFSKWYIKIIEEVDEINLIKREAYHLNLAMKKNKRLANLTGVTGTNLGIKRTDESKMRMSLAAKNRNEEAKENIESARQKIRETSEFKSKISIASKKMWASKEFRKKMLKRPVLQGKEHPNSKAIKISNSDYIFANALQAKKILQVIHINVQTPLISKVANGERKHHAFLKWEFVYENNIELTKRLTLNDKKIILNLQNIFKSTWEQSAYKGVNNKNSRPIFCKELGLCFLNCNYAKDYLEKKYDLDVNHGSLYSAAKRGNKFKGFYWSLLSKQSNPFTPSAAEPMYILRTDPPCPIRGQGHLSEPYNYTTK